ncbi:MAG: ferritin-like fold-containing protein [Rhodoglobus sp.]
MAHWFSRTSRRVDAPRLRSRTLDQLSTRVELIEFAPEPLEFLGRSAYVQLMLFENLSKAISIAPSTAAKISLARAAELSMSKHRRLVDEIVRANKEPVATMEPFTRAVDDFERDTRGADWFEIVLSCYLTAGFLDDFFARLALGLPSEAAQRNAAIFTSESGEALLVTVLQAAIDDNPRLAARLAMWGRRLVGDTMLLARSALRYSDDHMSDEARIEPVFTELIAAHTRRMDALGLAA